MLRSVLRRLAPGAVLVDLTHDIAPGDILGGALALERASPWLASGVVLGVVDPTVGTERRPIAVATASGLPLVGPDNGLLLPAAARLGGVVAAVELTAPAGASFPGLDVGGATFDGRDRFAPAAARLVNGEALADLGPPIDAESLVELALPPLRSGDGQLDATVIWIDHFGNAQLNCRPGDIAGWGTPVEVAVGDGCFCAAVTRSFADLPEGEIGLVVDSQGRLALAAYLEAAADRLGVSTGSEVRLRRSRP